MTTKASCTCTHKYQDEKYGKTIRVFNASTKKVGVIHKCTVCNREKAL